MREYRTTRNQVEIEADLERACGGEAHSAESFFRGFLSFEWIVLRRNQSLSLEYVVESASGVLDILAFDYQDQITVPIFTGISAVKQWSQSPLASRTILGANLLRVLPKGWWLAINPASDISKDLSPWEIKLMQVESFDALDELVGELYKYKESLSFDPYYGSQWIEGEESQPGVVLAETGESHYFDLKSALAEAAELSGDVEELYLLFESDPSSKSIEGESLLLGVIVPSSVEPGSAITKYSELARLGLVGDRRLKVIEGSAESHTTSLLSSFTPFWIKGC